MTTDAPGPADAHELLRETGAGLTLLAMTLAGFVTFDRPVSSQILVAVSATGLLVILMLPLARVLPIALPFCLAGVGIAGIGLVLPQLSNPYPDYPGTGWWRTVLLLLACGFLAASAWLTWRATHRLSRLARSAPGSRQRWGLLLSPVLGMIIVLLAPWTGLRWTVAVALALAAGTMFLGPAVAADLATLGLVVLGLGVITLTVHPPPAVAGSLGLLSPYYWDTASVPPPLAMVAGVQGAAMLAFGLWLAPRTIGAHARLLLRSDTALAGRVEQLTQTRAQAVDSAAAELRRVERDLHDGAQARLVALGMNLRAAERVVETSPQAALALLAEARAASSKALSELRDLVRGIYPPVLADRGIGDAVRALALDTPIRTETDIDLPGRLDAPVEAACYFAVAETLANAVKHSGAGLVQVRIRHSGDRPAGRLRSRAPRSAGMLRITVTDDGVGGADPAGGTGLRGVERRLGTFDGILAVSSPPGGPTMIIMEVPCTLTAVTGTPR